MRKIAMLLCTWSAVALADGPMPSPVPIGSGGSSANGISLNGIYPNGIWENGAWQNGVYQNGLPSNGQNLNGFNLSNGNKGVTYQGLRWSPVPPASSSTGFKVSNAAARGGRLFIRK